ncbi:MAG TPA: Xaa-Pro peptidase family protein [Anaerolineaceae bacterium]
MRISPEKLARAQKALQENGLDALFCRLAEHVLYFTGYWPHGQVGAAVVPASGKPVLLIGEMEAGLEFAAFPPSEGVEVVTFPFESAEVMRGPVDCLAAALPVVFKKLGLEGGTVGIEQSFEGCNAGIFQGEVRYPSFPTWQMLNAILPNLTLKDATPLLLKLRQIKSPEEVEAIRLAVETAAFGLQAAREAVRPGMKETELAAVVESAIHSRGTGYKGIAQARGYAAVNTGDHSATQWSHYACSTDRAIREGDMVIIELGSFADGYWADLTRNIAVGEVDPRFYDLYGALCEAQQAVYRTARPGVPLSDLVRAARATLAKYGFEGLWPHGLGHGTGFAYHEGPPVHIANPQPVEAGMVLTVEPGLYIPGLGGVRPEDMILVRDDGVEVLSDAIPRVL